MRGATRTPAQPHAHDAGRRRRLLIELGPAQLLAARSDALAYGRPSVSFEDDDGRQRRRRSQQQPSTTSCERDPLGSRRRRVVMLTTLQAGRTGRRQAPEAAAELTTAASPNGEHCRRRTPIGARGDRRRATCSLFANDRKPPLLLQSNVPIKCARAALVLFCRLQAARRHRLGLAPLWHKFSSRPETPKRNAAVALTNTHISKRTNERS
jgi:hypothetical protein